MAMRKGEKYTCSNPECGCEIGVTKASESPNANRSPRCCCGEDMMPNEAKRRATAVGGRSDEDEGLDYSR